MSNLTGKQLINITLPSSKGEAVTLPDDIQGKYTILYFYPKDDTPGCTKQACSYRDIYSEIKDMGAEIYGVSLDDLDSHREFINKYNLNFTLLYDKDHKLSSELEVYGDQEFKGNVFKGLSRDTFLIGPEGTILKVWRNVDPVQSVRETVTAIKNFRSPEGEA